LSIPLVNTPATLASPGSQILLPPGNYRLSDLEFLITGLIASAVGTYEYIGNISSGNQIIHQFALISFTTDTVWQQLNIDLSRSWNKPLDYLILTPNTGLTFNCEFSSNISGFRAMINITGFTNTSSGFQN
jgi:hypothetical protein